MPFDPAPIQTETPFTRVADTMLRGCTKTAPALPGEAAYEEGGRVVRACAFYSYQAGGGDIWCREFGDVAYRYVEVYGYSMVDDYEVNGLTREQIAARIAALR